MSVAVARELTKRAKKTHTSAVPLLLQQIQLLKLPAATIELKFHPARAWRFDVVFVRERVAVEVDGGAWISGRHARGQGIEDDNEKIAEATIMGWTVFRVTPRQVKNGQAVTWLSRYFTQQEPPCL